MTSILEEVYYHSFTEVYRIIEEQEKTFLIFKIGTYNSYDNDILNEMNIECDMDLFYVKNLIKRKYELVDSTKEKLYSIIEKIDRLTPTDKGTIDYYSSGGNIYLETVSDSTYLILNDSRSLPAEKEKLISKLFFDLRSLLDFNLHSYKEGYLDRLRGE